jgi:predicted ATPase/class 3 adenylate cyclase
VTLSTRTLLFTDIEGSTPLLERARGQYPVLLNEHRRIMRAAVEHAGGVEHGTEGDSFFVTFDSPTAALAAVVEAQLGLEQHPWPDGLRVRVRMGLHVGEVLRHEGDLVGMAIHHAARIGAAAHGGQIIISDAVAAMVRSLPDEAELRSLGRHRLRDVGEIELFQIDHPSLQAQFPAPRGVQTQRTNLPRITTEFVGGDSLLATIEEHSTAAALVTLTGTGGVGKTRAAIEYASRHMDRFPNGVYFVDLAPITETDAVVGAITSVLPIVTAGGPTPIDNLIEWLADRTMLLLIDNCEHLVADVHDVADALLQACPNLRILTTSREALGLRGERVIRVPSLDASSDAVDLFHHRALAADSSFTIDGHRDTIVQICTRLDGIPLAIELAASRVRSLSPIELLARLEDRFRLLRGSGRGTLDRHQTLRATVTWSYQLLTPHEQLFFDRLSVFAGGWTLASAEAVCGYDPIDELDVVDLLASLVDKSMVVAERGPVDTRYRLLKTIRQFAEERIEARNDPSQLRDRHAAHVGDLARDLGRRLMTSEELTATRALDQEWDNIRAAHQWALARRDLDNAERIVAAVYNFADLRLRHEHEQMTQRTLELADSMGLPNTQLCSFMASWRNINGSELENLSYARRGIELAPFPEHPSTAKCWYELCGASPLNDVDSADVRDAYAHMRRAVEAIDDIEHDWMNLVNLVDAALSNHDPDLPLIRARLDGLVARLASPRLTSFSLLFEGHENLLLGNAAGAWTTYSQMCDLARTGGDGRAESMALRSLALVAAWREEPDALARCREALELLYDIRYWQKLWQTMDSTTLALAHADRHHEAATVLGHLDTHMAACGWEHRLHFRDRARELLNGEEVDTALADGARMTADEIVLAAIEWCSQ